jgi:hypothetical protein
MLRDIYGSAKFRSQYEIWSAADLKADMAVAIRKASPHYREMKAILAENPRPS